MFLGTGLSKRSRYLRRSRQGTRSSIAAPTGGRFDNGSAVPAGVFSVQKVRGPGRGDPVMGGERQAREPLFLPWRTAAVLNRFSSSGTDPVGFSLLHRADRNRLEPLHPFFSVRCHRRRLVPHSWPGSNAWPLSLWPGSSPSGPVAFSPFSMEIGRFRNSITRIEPFAGGRTDGLKTGILGESSTRHGVARCLRLDAALFPSCPPARAGTFPFLLKPVRSGNIPSISWPRVT